MAPFFDPRLALYDAYGPMAGKHGKHGHNYTNLEGGHGVASLSDMKPPCAHGLGARRQLNWLAILMALLVPVGLFTGTFCLMSFELYYHHPQRALMVVALAFFSTLLIAAFSVQAHRTELGGGARTWHFFIFSTGFVACFLGTCLGYVNLNVNALRYYDYISLRKAVDVDPGRSQGQELLDAGEVDFKIGTKIDRNFTSLWHKSKTWCVAPLVSKDGARLASYDFWAVGLDCCSTQTGDFSCGDVYTSWAFSSQTPSGLRVLDSSEIQAYKLAVMQASAAYNIQSIRPIFLYMMKTPYVAIKSYLHKGEVFAIGACVCFFLLQSMLVISQSIAFGKDAPSGYMDMDKTYKMFFHHFHH